MIVAVSTRQETAEAAAQRYGAKLGADRAGRAGCPKDLTELPVPAKYRWVRDGLPGDSRYNVAQLYARSAESIRDRKPASPSFAAAVTRHRLLDAIIRASETGQKQMITPLKM
jgi:hypothetical protein